MDHVLAAQKKKFNEAAEAYGLDKEAAESVWAFMSSVGMPTDDFLLPFMLHGSRVEKILIDAKAGLDGRISEFDRDLVARLDHIMEAATKEAAAHNSKIAAGLGDEIGEAVDTAVDKAVEIRAKESRARERSYMITAATLCVCGVLVIGGVMRVDGYVSGRDYAVITSSRFEALSKDPAAEQIMKVVELNDPSVFSSYCGRGSGNLKEIAGRLQCTVPLWISGPASTGTPYLDGRPNRTWATLENWAATSSFWLLLLIGAAGGLMIRKGLRNFGRLGPVRWLLDIE